MNIGNLCKPHVQVIFPDTEITDAARMMRDRHVGDLVVVDRASEKIPIGMVTDRDIIVGVIAQGLPVDKVTVSDVMSHNVLTASYDDDIADVTAMMRAYGLQRIPIVSQEGYLVGIFSMEDALGVLAYELDKLAGLRVRAIDVETRSRRTHKELAST